MSALQVSSGVPAWMPLVQSRVAFIPQTVWMVEQDFVELYDEYLQEVQNVGLDAYAFIDAMHIKIM